MAKTTTPHIHGIAGAESPARWQDYVLLLKPRVMSLVVFTALTGFVCAGAPMNPVLAAVAILCIAVGAGAAGALNMWFDADIDAKMRRTRDRPLPAGRVQGADALALGVTLALFSVALMGLAINLLAAGLLAFTIFFYAVVYTMWLKRRTAQNIVIGGLAGALPPAVGWAAASGTAPLNAWLMVAIIFVWTPPHFWALSLTTGEDYARAGVPMMPVAKPGLPLRRRDRRRDVHRARGAALPPRPGEGERREASRGGDVGRKPRSLGWSRLPHPDGFAVFPPHEGGGEGRQAPVRLFDPLPLLLVRGAARRASYGRAPARPHTMSDPKNESAAARRARNGRNIALALGLAAFVAIVFFITLAHLGANVAVPHRF